MDVITQTSKRFRKRFDNGRDKHKNKIIMEIGKKVNGRVDYYIRRVSDSYDKSEWGVLDKITVNLFFLIKDNTANILNRSLRWN